MKPGEIVAGKYRLDARLGIGGMGEVWRATHTGTGREFAVKFMHPHTATSATARERFAREARASATVNHPSVIDVFDIGEHDEGALYLAMELLDGVPLADAFGAANPLSVHDLCVIMHDTARALAAAHAVGIIHRDIKPANIFLHKDRATGLAAAKILDFGISKFVGLDDQTQTGAILGSPRYMSPEQARSAAVDPLADVWACGVILFEGLTGTWPHEGESYSALVVAICTVPPRSIDDLAPGVPEAVRAVVRGCLATPDKRIGSAAELADRLSAALADPTLAERPLARPRHPPADPGKVVSGVRIRPLLSTTGSSPGSPLAFALPPMPVPPRTAPLPLPPPASVPLDGTFETLATTTLREPAGAVRVPETPVAVSSSAGRAPPPREAPGLLRMVAAGLAVLFAGIVVALVAVLRSGSTAGEGVVAAGASSVALAAPALPSASAVEVPAEPATAQPAPAPPPASAEPKRADAKRARTPPPPPPARPSLPPPTGAKVKELGSGL
jgi:serine/threonine protein kinase